MIIIKNINLSAKISALNKKNKLFKLFSEFKIIPEFFFCKKILPTNNKAQNIYQNNKVEFLRKLNKIAETNNK